MIYQNDYFLNGLMCCSGRKAASWRGRISAGLLCSGGHGHGCRGDRGIKKLTQQASQKFGVFLTARTASSAGMAVQALDQAWELVSQLPLYNKLPLPGGREVLSAALSMSCVAMSRSWTGCSQWGRQRMRCCVVGTGCITAWQTIFSRFRYDTDDMLTDYFEELPSRRPEAYAAAFESCMASFREIYMQTEDEEDLAYMSGRRINFPVGISLCGGA